MRKKYLKVLSRHPSHRFLRNFITVDKTIVIRFGSLTRLKADMEINSVESIQNSRDKKLMKKCFSKHNIKTCQWVDSHLHVDFFPVIAKHRLGSRGTGNYKLDTKEQFDTFVKNKANIDMFIFEKYTNFSREYRLHVTKQGCFYACRKVRKRDSRVRWKFNNSTCNWIREDGENPGLFNKPATWKIICEECVKAIKAVGLDIGCCDVRVSKEGDFKIIETNSAPSLKDYGKKFYLQEIKKIICAD